MVILIFFLAAYIVFLQLQLRSINGQLDKRLTENTRQPISLEMFNSKLNALACNINKCLKVEEKLRLNGIREEKQFKEMIANISHDLRTPLTAIKGYQQLMEKGELSTEQRKKLKVAQKHVDELGNLIEHFFEYSYLLNAKVEPNLERTNVTNLVTECLADSIAVFEEKGLTLHLEETPPMFVIADKEMTVRIVQNLIRNCAAHSVGAIEVGMHNKENVVISFRNPVENSAQIDVNRLFERFYMADKAKSKSTGLGLSIVKMLVEQMDGNVGAALEDNMIEIWVELPTGKIK